MAESSPEGVLESLLRQDGIELPGSGENRMIRCWNTSHNDSGPSMSINVMKGVYHCFGCDIQGGVISYLMDFRSLNRTEAWGEVQKFGWTRQKFDYDYKLHSNQETKKKGVTASFSLSIIEELKERNNKKTKPRVIGRKIAEHDYVLTDGTLVCRRARYAQIEIEGVTEKCAKILSYSPRKEGGWWINYPKADSIPVEERLKQPLPLYRLPDLLATIERDPTRHIYLVEGEKCVDAVLTMAKPPTSGPPPATCLFGGMETKFDRHDLTPLSGHNIIIVADTDEHGREIARKVGKNLTDQLGCIVRFVLPPGDGGYDVASALGEGGWPSMRDWLTKIGFKKYEDVFPPNAEAIKAQIDKSGNSLSENKEFQIIGLHDNTIVVRRMGTFQLLHVPCTAISAPGWLQCMAPLDWWNNTINGSSFSQNNARTVIADEILRIAEKKGIVDLASTMIGRGAFAEDDKIHYHMGSHVLKEDANGLLTEKISLGDVRRILRAGPQIHTKTDPGSTKYAQELYETMMEFKWAEPDDGKCYLGWVVTSLIGGALPFRPMLWVISPAGSGKTFLMDVLVLIMGSTMLAVSNQTEAGIADVIRDDSLPVWVDEFEPLLGKEDRFDGFLALIRQSTSGNALRVRGGAYRAQNSTPRFSVFCSSIHQPPLEPADEQRFTTIHLSREGRTTAEWNKFERSIRAIVTSEKASSIRGHIIANTAKICGLASSKQQELSTVEGVTTRDSQIFGALSAGACFLSGNEGIMIEPRHASSGNQEDDWHLLEILLTTVLAVGGGLQQTLGEAMRIVIKGVEYYDTREVSRAFLGRHGICVEETEKVVYFAHTSEAIRRPFKGSKYENVNLRQCFKALSVAEKTGRHWFAGTRYACVGITNEKLEEIGFL